MMQLKKTAAKMLTNLVINIAQKASGQASIGCTYQPKEPKSLQNLKK